MTIHEYDPRDALDYLLKALQEKCGPLGEEIQRQISVGKVVTADPSDLRDSETDLLGDRSRAIKSDRGSPYRQWRTYTPEEALEIALNVLESYFVVHPSVANSAAKNLDGSLNANAEPREPPAAEAKIEFELHTESPTDDTRSLIPLERTPTAEIREQAQNIKSLRELIRFSGD